MGFLRYGTRIAQCFLNCVPDRTRNTLEDVILHFILPGIRIISDC